MLVAGDPVNYVDFSFCSTLPASSLCATDSYPTFAVMNNGGLCKPLTNSDSHKDASYDYDSDTQTFIVKYDSFGSCLFNGGQSN